jgi:hypothetical protein
MELAHVRHVEQAGPLAHGAVLGQDARVLDRHREAGELDEPRAEGAVPFEERRAAQVGLRAAGRAQAAAALEPESEPPPVEPPPLEPESLFAALSAAGFESPLSFFEPFFDEE